MGHQCRKRDKRFHSTKAFRERTELHVIEKTASRFQGAQVKGKHATRAFLLAARNFVLWMTGQSRVKNLLNFRMGVEVTRDYQSISIVLQHAHRESLDAARNQKTIHGRQSGTRGALNKINSLGVFLAS